MEEVCLKKENVSFNVSTHKEGKYSKAEPGKVVVKDYIDGFILLTFTLKKYISVPELSTVRAYPFGQVPINVNKTNDLKQLIKYTTGYE